MHPPTTKGNGEQFADHEVTELWTLVAINDVGDEGIVGGMNPETGAHFPCVTSSAEMMDKVVQRFRDIPEDIKNKEFDGQTFEVRHFTEVDRSEVSLYAS